MKLLQLFLLFVAALPLASADRPFYDRTHFSKVLGEERNYRILLPPDYESSIKRYPVIYYFHGHSDRYTLEKYDDGKDTVPKMADFVAHHDVIVVSVDGYVARDYTGFYGGTPWDVMREGGDHDFGEYFKELVTHIEHDVPHVDRSTAPRHFGSQHGRVHEPVAERALSATDRQRLCVQSGA
jgi:poly(3-hydroxybutyrate) depolymerase